MAHSPNAGLRPAFANERRDQTQRTPHVTVWRSFVDHAVRSNRASRGWRVARSAKIPVSWFSPSPFSCLIFDLKTQRDSERRSFGSGF
jgi:hypothetical protein